MADQLLLARATDANGDIVSDAVLYPYAEGTSTPKTVYTDDALTTPHDSPVEADAEGVFPPIFLLGGVKVDIKNGAGVSLPGYPRDKHPTSPSGGGAAGQSFGDDVSVKFGDGDDLTIYHDSATGDSIITESGPGDFRIQCSEFKVGGPVFGVDPPLFTAHTGGTVALYNDGIERLRTNAQGVLVAGRVALTSGDGFGFQTGDGHGITQTQSTTVVFHTGSSGTLRFQPNGAGNATGQMVLTSDGNLSISGSLSKGSGTFLIDHPLDPSTKDLAHGFVEAPRYELIYRGTATLTSGAATVDIDAASGMSPGTFAALTTNAVVSSLQNLSGFSRCKPGAISGGSFEIECEDAVSDEVSWVVIAERNDPFVKRMDANCDERGRFIPERDKESGASLRYATQRAEKRRS